MSEGIQSASPKLPANHGNRATAVPSAGPADGAFDIIFSAKLAGLASGAASGKAAGSTAAPVESESAGRAEQIGATLASNGDVAVEPQVSTQFRDDVETVVSAPGMLPVLPGVSAVWGGAHSASSSRQSMSCASKISDPLGVPASAPSTDDPVSNFLADTRLLNPPYGFPQLERDPSLVACPTGDGATNCALFPVASPDNVTDIPLAATDTPMFRGSTAVEGTVVDVAASGESGYGSAKRLALVPTGSLPASSTGSSPSKASLHELSVQASAAPGALDAADSIIAAQLSNESAAADHPPSATPVPSMNMASSLSLMPSMADPSSAPAAPGANPGLNNIPASHSFAGAPGRSVELLSNPGTPAWRSEFSDSVRILVGSQVQSAELKLNPSDMGPVSVRIIVADQQASIVFAAANEDTRRSIEQSLPQLRDMLAESGIRLGNASVGDHPAREQASAAARTHGEEDDLAVPAAASFEIRASRYLIDTYA